LHHTPNPTHDYKLLTSIHPSTMKTSFLILSAVFAASTATVNANFHLRASTPQIQDQDQDANADNSLDRHRSKPDKPSPNGKWGFMGAVITVTHVSGDKINLDEERVSQTFVQAYNKVHNNGYRVTTGFIEKAVIVPESADLSNDQELFSTVIFDEPFGYECPKCPAEFGLDGEKDSLEATSRPKPADDSKVHEKFEKYFLETLRSSDMAAFADIQAVHIVFTYTDPTTTTTADDKSVAEEQPGVEKRRKKTKPSGNESTHGQIEISHTMADHNSSTVIDMKTLGEVYEQAFDEVYSFVDYEATSFDLESEIDIPEDTGSEAEAEVEEGTPDTLEWFGYYFINKYSFSFSWGCRFCANDDDLLGSSLDLVAMQGTGAHRYFEKLFCHKMKKSGLIEFQKITHCSIDFAAAASDASYADSVMVTSSQ
jgi:hypothetical protein